MKKSYYAEGRRFEPIDVISDWKLNFNLGNTIKYISRAGRKTEDPLIDLYKAKDYLEYEIKRLVDLEIANESENPYQE